MFFKNSQEISHAILVKALIDKRLTKCGSADIGSAGWSLEETGASGEDKCYTCKKLACKPGYSTETTTCEAGYELVTKDYSGDDACGKCVEKDCSAGYSKSITSETDCSAGYEFEQEPDNPLCGKCVEKDCSAGYSKSITSEANCSAGYEFEQEPDNPLCGKCKVKPCETGYSTDVTTCEAGYEIVTNGYSGEQECKKCDKSPCSAGYSDTITSETDCSAGYSFKQDPDNPLCGMCVEKSCPDGFTAGLTDPSQCGVGGEEGWFVEFNGNESCGLCTPKTCGDHGLESTRYNTVCLSEKVYIGNDLVDCYDCVGCDKFDIYNLSGSLYDVYRDSIDISCSEWCRYDKSTPDITDEAIPYLIYKKSVKDKAGRSGDCYGLIDITGKWEIETNEKKMCCCLYGEDLTASGCIESGK